MARARARARARASKVIHCDHSSMVLNHKSDRLTVSARIPQTLTQLISDQRRNAIDVGQQNM